MRLFAVLFSSALFVTVELVQADVLYPVSGVMCDKEQSLISYTERMKELLDKAPVKPRFSEESMRQYVGARRMVLLGSKLKCIYVEGGLAINRKIISKNRTQVIVHFKLVDFKRCLYRKKIAWCKNSEWYQTERD